MTARFFNAVFTILKKLITPDAVEKANRDAQEVKRKESDYGDAISAQNKARAKRLAEALDYAVTLPYYKKGYECWPDGKQKTFCNVLARKFLLGNFDYGLYDNFKDPAFAWLNYDIYQVFDGMTLGQALYNCDIETTYNKAILASTGGRVRLCTPEQAQKEANTGEPIWVICKLKGWQHECIIYPDYTPYNPDKGPKIAQAGNINISNVYISDRACFGTGWKGLDLIFVKLPRLPDNAGAPVKNIT